MSSLWRSRRPVLVVAVLLAVTGGVFGCGGDDQGTQAAEPSPPASTATTDSAPAPTTPGTSTSERRVPRKPRRAEAKPRRPRRETTRSATATNPEPPPETTPEAPPAPPELEPKPEPKRTGPKKSQPPGKPEERLLVIDETATLKLVERKGVTYWQEGTVEGTLSGTITVRTTIGGPGVLSAFTVTLEDGSIRGRARARVRPDGSVVHYKGTATITGGTGTYAGARGRNLRYSGTGASDASTATARLSGTLRY